MKKSSFILITILALLGAHIHSQSDLHQKSSPSVEKAEYAKGNINEVLSGDLRYPIEALRNKIQGDVILSFIVDSTGQLDSLRIVSSPAKSLSSSSILAFDQLDNDWIPYKIDGIASRKVYYVVFRYRQYSDALPPDYREKANNFINKQKYKKALKTFDKAIVDNAHKHDFFHLRALVKQKLGDQAGASEDLLEAKRLEEEIIAVLDVQAVAVSRKKRIISSSANF